MTVLKLMPESVACAGWCGRLLHPWRAGTRPDVPGPTVYARGLCYRCHAAARRRGLVSARTPRRRTFWQVPRGVVLENVARLSAEGVARREMPARLGMTAAAFDRAMRRARAAGDPRAAGYGRAA